MKKFILFISLFITIQSFCQDIKITKDEFNGSTIIECSTEVKNTLFPSTISNDFFLSLKCLSNTSSNGTNSIFLIVGVNNNKILCFNKNNIIFLFENGKKITLHQYSDLKCNTYNAVIYSISKTDIIDFENDNLDKVRIETTDGYIDATIKDKKKQLIKDTFIKFVMTANL